MESTATLTKSPSHEKKKWLSKLRSKSISTTASLFSSSTSSSPDRTAHGNSTLEGYTDAPPVPPLPAGYTETPTASGLASKRRQSILTLSMNGLQSTSTTPASKSSSSTDYSGGKNPGSPLSTMASTPLSSPVSPLRDMSKGDASRRIVLSTTSQENQRAWVSAISATIERCHTLPLERSTLASSTSSSPERLKKQSHRQTIAVPMSTSSDSHMPDLSKYRMSSFTIAKPEQTIDPLSPRCSSPNALQGRQPTYGSAQMVQSKSDDPSSSSRKERPQLRPMNSSNSLKAALYRSHSSLSFNHGNEDIVISVQSSAVGHEHTPSKLVQTPSRPANYRQSSAKSLEVATDGQRPGVSSSSSRPYLNIKASASNSSLSSVSSYLSGRDRYPSPHTSYATSYNGYQETSIPFNSGSSTHSALSSDHGRTNTLRPVPSRDRTRSDDGHKFYRLNNRNVNLGSPTLPNLRQTDLSSETVRSLRKSPSMRLNTFSQSAGMARSNSSRSSADHQQAGRGGLEGRFSEDGTSIGRKKDTKSKFHSRLSSVLGSSSKSRNGASGSKSEKRTGETHRERSASASAASEQQRQTTNGTSTSREPSFSFSISSRTSSSTANSGSFGHTTGASDEGASVPNPRSNNLSVAKPSDHSSPTDTAETLQSFAQAGERKTSPSDNIGSHIVDPAELRRKMDELTALEALEGTPQAHRYGISSSHSAFGLSRLGSPLGSSQRAVSNGSMMSSSHSFNDFAQYTFGKPSSTLSSAQPFSIPHSTSSSTIRVTQQPTHQGRFRSVPQSNASQSREGTNDSQHAQQTGDEKPIDVQALFAALPPPRRRNLADTTQFPS